MPFSQRIHHYSLLLLFFFVLSTPQLGAQNTTTIPVSGKYVSKGVNINSQIESLTFAQSKIGITEVKRNGAVHFDPSSDITYGDYESEVISQLVNSNHTSFQEGKTSKSRLDGNAVFIHFQQYYKGLEVINGGYSLKIISGPGPVGPCSKISALNPNIVNNLNLDTLGVVSNSSINSIMNTHQYYLDLNSSCTNWTVEKKIALLPTDQNFKVIYQVTCPQIPEIQYWIDPSVNQVVRTIKPEMGIRPGPTEDYQNPDLIDFEENGIVSLVTPPVTVVVPDGDDYTRQVLTYNMENINVFDRAFVEGDFDLFANGLIPTINNSQLNWTLADAVTDVYQAHHVVTVLAEEFREIGLDFGTIHVGANMDNFNVNAANVPIPDTFSPNARAIGNINDRECRILFGMTAAGNTMAVFDLAAHELAHIYLRSELGTNEVGNRSMHEGIADIFGIYMDFKATNRVNWVIGDDIPLVIRDFINPLNNNSVVDEEFGSTCFDDVEDHGIFSQHARSTPLSHWFYRLYTGGDPNTRPHIPMLTTINIVMDALAAHPSRSLDYEELMELTLVEAEETYGRCSPEFVAMANAWEAICVDTGETGSSGSVEPCFVIGGGRSACEESGIASFCAEGILVDENTTFSWTFIGPNTTSWNLGPNQSGNSVHGQKCVKVSGFPNYPYYPQKFTIQLRSTTLGGEFTQRIQFTLDDCDQDDPTSCLGGLKAQVGGKSLVQESNLPDVEGFKGYRLYSMSGQEVGFFDSDINLDVLRNKVPAGIYIKVLVGTDGSFKESTKIVIIK